VLARGGGSAVVTVTAPPLDASLEAYIGALLAPREPDVEPSTDVSAEQSSVDVRAVAPSAAGVESSADVLELKLVKAAGLVFALPAGETADADDAACGAARIIDLAAVATGRPSAAVPATRLALIDHPGVLIAVDSCEGLVEVPSERVRWRTAGGARPWLAGMLDDPRAAVVSVRHLVEEG